jgi:hypothetical protein
LWLEEFRKGKINMPTKHKPTKQAPKAPISNETEQAFGDLPIKPSDFSGALLQGGRFLVYTSLERTAGQVHGAEKGKTVPYTIYRRGPVIVGVYLDTDIITEDIPGEILFGPDGFVS